MGGGYIQLVASNNMDNIFLTGRPQITYFKTVYRRHSNFSMFTSTLQPKSSNEYVTFNLDRKGDLINKLYLGIDIVPPKLSFKKPTNTYINNLLSQYGVTIPQSIQSPVTLDTYNNTIVPAINNQIETDVFNYDYNNLGLARFDYYNKCNTNKLLTDTGSSFISTDAINVINNTFIYIASVYLIAHFVGSDPNYQHIIYDFDKRTNPTTYDDVDSFLNYYSLNPIINLCIKQYLGNPINVYDIGLITMFIAYSTSHPTYGDKTEYINTFLKTSIKQIKELANSVIITNYNNILLTLTTTGFYNNTSLVDVVELSVPSNLQSYVISLYNLFINQMLIFNNVNKSKDTFIFYALKQYPWIIPNAFYELFDEYLNIYQQVVAKEYNIMLSTLIQGYKQLPQNIDTFYMYFYDKLSTTLTNALTTSDSYLYRRSPSYTISNIVNNQILYNNVIAPRTNDIYTNFVTQMAFDNNAIDLSTFNTMCVSYYNTYINAITDPDGYDTMYNTHYLLNDYGFISPTSVLSNLSVTIPDYIQTIDPSLGSIMEQYLIKLRNMYYAYLKTLSSDSYFIVDKDVLNYCYINGNPINSYTTLQPYATTTYNNFGSYINLPQQVSYSNVVYFSQANYAILAKINDNVDEATLYSLYTSSSSSSTATSDFFTKFTNIRNELTNTLINNFGLVDTPTTLSCQQILLNTLINEFLLEYIGDNTLTTELFSHNNCDIHQIEELLNFLSDYDVLIATYGEFPPDAVMNVLKDKYYNLDYNLPYIINKYAYNGYVTSSFTCHYVEYPEEALNIALVEALGAFTALNIPNPQPSDVTTFMATYNGDIMLRFLVEKRFEIMSLQDELINTNTMKTWYLTITNTNASTYLNIYTTTPTYTVQQYMTTHGSSDTILNKFIEIFLDQVIILFIEYGGTVAQFMVSSQYITFQLSYYQQQFIQTIYQNIPNTTNTEEVMSELVTMNTDVDNYTTTDVLPIISSTLFTGNKNFDVIYNGLLAFSKDTSNSTMNICNSEDIVGMLYNYYLRHIVEKYTTTYVGTYIYPNPTYNANDIKYILANGTHYVIPQYSYVKDNVIMYHVVEAGDYSQHNGETAYVDDVISDGYSYIKPDITNVYPYKTTDAYITLKNYLATTNASEVVISTFLDNIYWNIQINFNLIQNIITYLNNQSPTNTSHFRIGFIKQGSNSVFNVTGNNFTVAPSSNFTSSLTQLNIPNVPSDVINMFGGVMNNTINQFFVDCQNAFNLSTYNNGYFYSYSMWSRIFVSQMEYILSNSINTTLWVNPSLTNYMNLFDMTVYSKIMLMNHIPYLTVHDVPLLVNDVVAKYFVKIFGDIVPNFPAFQSFMNLLDGNENTPQVFNGTFNDRILKYYMYNRIINNTITCGTTNVIDNDYITTLVNTYAPGSGYILSTVYRPDLLFSHKTMVGYFNGYYYIMDVNENASSLVLQNQTNVIPIDSLGNKVPYYQSWKILVDQNCVITSMVPYDTFGVVTYEKLSIDWICNTYNQLYSDKLTYYGIDNSSVTQFFTDIVNSFRSTNVYTFPQYSINSYTLYNISIGGTTLGNTTPKYCDAMSSIWLIINKSFISLYNGIFNNTLFSGNYKTQLGGMMYDIYKMFNYLAMKTLPYIVPQSNIVENLEDIVKEPIANLSDNNVTLYLFTNYVYSIGIGGKYNQFITMEYQLRHDAYNQMAETFANVLYTLPTSSVTDLINNFFDQNKSDLGDTYKLIYKQNKDLQSFGKYFLSKYGSIINNNGTFMFDVFNNVVNEYAIVLEPGYQSPTQLYLNQPQITSYTPPTCCQLCANIILITGTYLSTTTSVTFNGNQGIILETIDDSIIKVNVPPITQVGNVKIILTTSYGTVTDTLFICNAVPVITEVTPSYGPLYGGIHVDIYINTDVTDVSSIKNVLFGNVSCTFNVNVNHNGVYVTLPPSSSLCAVDVRLVTVEGISETSSLTKFIYNLSPYVLNVYGNSGSVGQDVLLYGGNFTNDTNTIITIGGVEAVIGIISTYIEMQYVYVTIPNCDPGIQPLIISTIYGVSPPRTFTVNGLHLANPRDLMISMAGPIISTISPTYLLDIGGTFVTITGYNFIGITITLNGTLVVNPTYTRTQITFTAPPNRIGEVQLIITNIYGSATNTIFYTHVPEIEALIPSSGQQIGGTEITIFGGYFTSATAVTFGFNGIPGVFNIVSDTEITVTTPKGTPGNVSLYVITQVGSDSKEFTYTENIPLVNSISPTLGTINGGTHVTITGRYFSLNCTVTISGIPTTITSLNPTQMIVVTPTVGETGTANVIIANSVGHSTTTFNYSDVPVLSSITPSSDYQAGGTSIVIMGQYLLSTTSIMFGSIPCTTYSIISDNEIDLIDPENGTPGDTNVVVTTSLGQASIGFTYNINPPPVISSVSPLYVPPGGMNINIIGNYFSWDCDVNINGQSVDIYEQTSTLLVAVAPPDTTIGAVDLIVTNNVGSYTTTIYYAGNPTITSIVPQEGYQFGGMTIAIYGEFLSSTFEIIFGSNASTFTIVNDNEVDVVVPSGSSAGLVSLGLGTLTGQAWNLFTYLENPIPSIDSITPTFGIMSGGTLVTINGNYFSSDCTVLFGNTYVPLVSRTITQITVTSLPYDDPTDITKSVNLVVANGTGSIMTSFTYVNIPTISSISPLFGLTSGGTHVTINGNYFTNDCVVTIDNLATTIISQTETQIVITTPVDGTIGLVDLLITNANGSCTTSFNYTDVPSLTSITPSSDYQAGGTNIVIQGQYLLSTTSILFGDVPCTSYVVVNDGEIDLIDPTGDVIGDINVTITTQVGTSTINFTYVINPSPEINTIVPSYGTIAGGTTVIINGNYFTNDCVVTIDSLPAVITSQTATQITTTTPADENMGAVNLTITNSIGTVTSIFNYTLPPTILSLTPSSGYINGNVSVVLVGTHLLSTTSITFGSVQCLSYSIINDDEIDLTVPTGISTGIVTVTLTTQVGTTTSIFTYIPYPPPEIDTITPLFGLTTGGTMVTIDGNYFSTDCVVRIDGTDATIMSQTLTQIVIITPANENIGSVDLTITNSIGSQTASFNYTWEPVIVSITPPHGYQTGGMSAVILGAYFTSTSSILFGDVPCTTYSIVNDGEINLVIPEGDVSGVVAVHVTTQVGTSTINFTYVSNPPPEVDTITPPAGIPNTHTTITLNGNYFIGECIVTINSLVATIMSQTTTQIVFTTPIDATIGTVDLLVSNNFGTYSGTFNYIPAPIIFSISPNNDYQSGNTNITITGLYLATTSSVTFGNVLSTVNIEITDNLVRIRDPCGDTTGIVDVVVTTQVGTATINFTYNPNPPPTISTIVPSSGSSNGGTIVTLTGTHFITVQNVFFGYSRASIISNTDTHIQLLTPANFIGNVDVTVITTTGQITRGNAFEYNTSTTPIINTINPSFGTIDGGTVVTLIGEYLSTTYSVKLGMYEGSNIHVINANTIQFTTPQVSNDMTLNIIVTTSDGTSSISDANVFTYKSIPYVTLLDPSYGLLSGAYNITITGNYLSGTQTVLFGNNPCTSIEEHTLLGNTYLVVSVPPASELGGVDVTIITSEGTTVNTSTFVYGMQPYILSVDPPQSSGGMITLYGLYLYGTTAIYINDVFYGVPLQIISDNEITFNISGSFQESLINVETQFGMSQNYPFPTFTSDTKPYISSMDKPFGLISGGNSFNIQGMHFLGGIPTIMFGTVQGTINHQNDTSMNVSVPPGLEVGQVHVIITTINGSSIPSSRDLYQYVDMITVTPSSGTKMGGTLITIVGTNMDNITTVIFNGFPYPSTPLSPTSVSMVTPIFMGDDGTQVSIEIQNATYQDVTYQSAFTYTDLVAPIIVLITPLITSANGGDTITLTGQYFTGVNALYVGSSSIDFTIVNDTTITFTTPIGSGDASVYVVNSIGNSNSVSFTYIDVPVITTITPTCGTVYGGTYVVINGTTLRNVTGVTFNGQSADFILINDTCVASISPVGVGSVDIAVTTMYGTSNTTTYTYIDIPIISFINPLVGSILGGTPITLSGQYFTNVNDVLFNNTSCAFTLIDPSTIELITPQILSDTANVKVVTVGGYSNIVTFTYISPPTITRINPLSGISDGGDNVIIYGKNFIDVLSVSMSIAECTYNVIDEYQISFVTPPKSRTLDGNVIVSTVYGTTTLPNCFSFVNLPLITSFEPMISPLQGNIAVFIYGDNFFNTQSVTFGPAPGIILSVTNNVIVVKCPENQLPGTYNIAVKTNIGHTTNVNNFIYTDQTPYITNITPTTGSTIVSNTITISGGNFLNINNIYFGTYPCISFDVIDNSTITVTYPTVDADMNVKIIVVGDYGTSPQNMIFTYISPPTVTEVIGYPVIQGGTPLIINGFDFVDVTSITFGGVQCVSYTNTDTSISVITPPNLIGEVVIDILTQYGEVVSSCTYIAPPWITSINPTSGIPSGGTTMNLYGYNLGNTTSIMFGDQTISNFTIVSDTQITLQSPACNNSYVVTIIPYPTSTSTTNIQFTYIPLPYIAYINPSTGLCSGNELVHIYGDNLTNVTNIQCGEYDVCCATLIDNGHIDILTPANINGLSNIIVTTASGTSAPFIYTYITHSFTMSPNYGINGNNVNVVTNFNVDEQTAVTFNDIIIPFTIVNNNTITFTVPNSLMLGTNYVTVGDVTNVFNGVETSPYITSIVPSAGSIWGGNTITVNGSNLGLVMNIIIGTEQCTILSVTDTSVILLDTWCGYYEITSHIRLQTNSCISYLGNNDLFTYKLTPVISQISPTYGTRDGGTNVYIQGTDLFYTTTVLFGNTQCTFNVIDDHNIIAISPQNNVDTVVNITVITLNGTSTSTNSISFTYIGDNPIITGIIPSIDDNNVISFNIMGINIINTLNVFLNNIQCDSVKIINSHLVKTTNQRMIGYNNPINALVQTSDGVGIYALGTIYTGQPTVTSISPNFGTAVSSEITVFGTNLFSPVTVYVSNWANIPLTPSSYASDGSYVIVTPPSTFTESIISDVTVQNAIGTSDVTVGDRFASIIDTSHILFVTGMYPTFGPLHGANTITVYGLGFNGVSDVTVGKNHVTSFTVVSNTELMIVIPSVNASTISDIVVTVTDESLVSYNSFVSQYSKYTYTNTPIVTSISPVYSSHYVPTQVTIYGFNFTGVTSILFGIYSVSTFTVVSDTQITTTNPVVGTTTTSTVDVIMTNTYGTSQKCKEDVFTFISYPEIYSVSPNYTSLETAYSDTITISGNNLFGVTSIKFGTQTTTAFNIINNNTITLTSPMPIEVQSVVNITVTSGNGVSLVTPTCRFTYLLMSNDPFINQIFPSGGLSSDVNLVSIWGGNFLGSGYEIGSVVYNSVVCSIVPQLSTSTNVVVNIPANMPIATSNVIISTVNSVTLETINNTFTNDFTKYTISSIFEIVNISTIYPTTGPATGGTQIEIVGNGFTNVIGVYFGTYTSTAFTVVNDNLITVTSPPTLNNNFGNVYVTLYTHTSTSLNNQNNLFSYTISPVITNISPNFGLYTGGTLVTVNGVYLTGCTNVLFGTYEGTSINVINDTTLTVISPQVTKPNGNDGDVLDIIITTPLGITSANVSDRFAYTDNTYPFIIGVSPTSGNPSGGEDIIIYGNYFLGATIITSVNFGGVSASNLTIVSNNEIHVTAPTGSVGVVDVTLNAIISIYPIQSITSFKSFADSYAYIPTPNIINVTPNYGSVNGGTVITINGSYFFNTTSITIGNVKINSFTVINDNQIQTITPAGVLGPVNISVTSYSGTGTCNNAFSYVKPYVLSLSPSFGTVLGNTDVTIKGVYFTGTSMIKFGDAVCTQYKIVNDTTIIATSPTAFNVGTVDVVVTSSVGVSQSVVSSKYTYLSIPRVDSVSPIIGTYETLVTITGTNFIGASDILFGNVSVSTGFIYNNHGFTVIDNNTIISSCPFLPFSYHTVDIVVVNPTGSSAITINDQFKNIYDFGNWSYAMAMYTYLYNLSITFAHVNVDVDTFYSSYYKNSSLQPPYYDISTILDYFSELQTNDLGFDYFSNTDPSIIVDAGYKYAVTMNPDMIVDDGFDFYKIGIIGTFNNVFNDTLTYCNTIATYYGLVQSNFVSTDISTPSSSPDGILCIRNDLGSVYDDNGNLNNIKSFYYGTYTNILSILNSHVVYSYVNQFNSSVQLQLNAIMYDTMNILGGINYNGISDITGNITTLLDSIDTQTNMYDNYPNMYAWFIYYISKYGITDVTTNFALVLQNATLPTMFNEAYGTLISNPLVALYLMEKTLKYTFFTHTQTITELQNNTITYLSDCQHITSLSTSLYPPQQGFEYKFLQYADVNEYSISSGYPLLNVPLEVKLLNSIMQFTPKYCWVNELGHRIIEKISLFIGGEEIETHDDVLLHLLHEIYDTKAHERGYNEMIGNTSAMTTFDTSPKSSKLHIPLRFFFCRNAALSLPLIAMLYTEALIRLKLSDLDKLIVMEDDVVVISKQKFKCDMIAHYIYLEETERFKMASTKLDYLIERFLYNGMYKIKNSDITSFIYTNPYITSISPNSGPITGGTVVTINGGNFNTNGNISNVYFGGIPCTYSVINDNQIQVTSPPQIKSGTVDIIVEVTRGSNILLSDVTKNDLFTFIGFGPAITSVVPNMYNAVDIYGTNFTGVTSVKFGKWFATYILKSDTHIQSMYPSNVYGIFVDVVVTTQFGSSPITTNDIFTFPGETPWGDMTSTQYVPIKIDLNMADPIKYLIWTVKFNTPNETINDWNKFGCPGVNPMFSNIKLKMFGVDRDEMDEMTATSVIPYSRASSGLGNGEYMYSFGLFPKLLQPSGTANFSQITDAYLEFLPVDKLLRTMYINKEMEADVNVWGCSYNILRCASGMAAPLFYS